MALNGASCCDGSVIGVWVGESNSGNWTCRFCFCATQLKTRKIERDNNKRRVQNNLICAVVEDDKSNGRRLMFTRTLRLRMINANTIQCTPSVDEIGILKIM